MMRYLLIACFLFGCGSAGFDDLVPVGEEVIVDLGYTTGILRVHICEEGNGMLGDNGGWAASWGHIYVRGYLVPGGVTLDYWVLGHEVAHLLHWADDRVVDPDIEGGI